MSRGIKRERQVRLLLEAQGWWTDQAFLDRFWSKVERSDGCWEWQGAKSKGYGRIWTARPDRSCLQAHRVAYTIEHGLPDESLVIDHLCRNSGCVNPAHLEAVPQSVNVQRDSRDHCPKGHPLDGVRRQTDPDGSTRIARWCRQCDVERKQVRRAARVRGTERERSTKKLLEADGWLVTRAAGSLGVADLIALKAPFPPRLVQVKSDTVSPYGHFGPQDRADLAAAARKAGAEAWLVWWPPRKQPVWTHSEDWPKGRAA